MSGIETRDFFADNPFREFVGAGFEKYRPNWKWDRNLKNASLYFIADGELNFRLFGKDFTAKKNDVVFLTSGDIAEISNITDTYSSLYYIAFNYDENTVLLDETLFEDTSYRNLFKDILEAHLSKAHFSSMRILQLFTKLIYNLSIDSLHKSKEYILTSRIQSAAEYININYYKSISIDTLCRLSGYSPAHLRRLFIKTYGMSPNDYIINKRMEMAMEILKDMPEKTIEETADLVGISSGSYFCKLFKKRSGLSPNDYKKKYLS